MVLKSTDLSSRFQHKNRFRKIYTGSWDKAKRAKNQTCIILDVLANISGPSAYFSKLIFALKPCAQAGRFKYHEPYKQNNFFFKL